MAVKSHYKIPASLDTSHLDMEIALQNKEGIGLRPMPMRAVMVYVFGIVAGFWILGNGSSPISSATFGLKALTAIIWILFVLFCGKVDKAHQMQIELIPAFLTYMNKSSRVVLTRHINNAAPFYSIAGIESIDDNGRVVKYLDGTYGIWYAVVGSASILLFPEDRDAILLKVDDFYKKLPPDCEIAFMTAKEAQKVARQKAHVVAQYKHMEFADPDMDKLIKEQFNALNNFVGKEFKSLHQYMIVKGDSMESLTVIDNVIRAECENSNLVFKSVTPLYKDDIIQALATIYKEGD